MIKVQLFKKVYIKSDETERKLISSKDFPKPKSYDDFISSINQAFKLNGNEISLLAFTNEEDENPINDQDDLDDNKEDTQEYRIIIEKGGSSPSKPEPKKSKKEKEEKEEKDDEEKEDDNEKKKDDDKKKQNEDKSEESQEEKGSENGGNEEDYPIEIKIDVNLDISEKEMEKIIDSQIKPVPEIEKDIYNDELQFDVDEYKKGINIKYNNIINDFNELYDSKLKTIINEKSNLLKEQINKQFTEFSTVNINNISEINKDSEELKGEFDERVGEVKDMNNAIMEMSKIIIGGEIKRPKRPRNTVAEEEEGNDEEKKEILFKKAKIEEEIQLEDAKKDFEIPITIEKIINKKYKKLFFVKDEDESSKDVIFYGNKENLQQLTNSDKSEETHYAILKIKEPKPNQEYNLYLYVTEKIEGKNLSNKLQIILKVKGEEKVEVEDPQKRLEEVAYKLYFEFSKKHDLNIIATKEAAIQKFIKLNNDNDSINNWIKDEFNKKCDELYSELSISDIIKKDEAKKEFANLKYDKEKIKEWAQSKIEQNNNDKAENLYKELEKKFENLNEKLEKNQIIEKIKKENFNEKNLIEWIKPQIRAEPEPEPVKEKEPILGSDPGENAKIEKIIRLLDDEYNILGILDEEEVRAKIKELNFDEKKIREWIEKKLGE